MRVVGVIVVALLAACDIPTELPKWNPTFAVRLEGTTIPLAQFLPTGVAVADASTFVVSAAPFAFPTRLGDICPACAQQNGQVVPKPAISITLGQTLALPAGVDSATIVGGNLEFAITNEWGFDILRPGAGQFGNILVQVRPPTGPSRGFTAIDGRDRALPSGSTLTGTLSFTGPAVQTLNFEVGIHSPAGDPVRMDAMSSLTIAVTSGGVTATDAIVRVGPRQLTSQTMQLNFTGVDEFVIQRVRGGTLVLDVDNGFGVSGTMALSVTGGLAPIHKTFELVAASGIIEIPFTEPELESLLGRSVSASVSGFVNTPAPVRVTPASSFRIEPLLVLELGPSS